VETTETGAVAKDGTTEATSKSEGQEFKALPSPSGSSEKQGAIQVRQSGLATQNRPVDTSGSEILETIMMSGARPIMASHLEIYGMIFNNRPIMASHLHVVDTDSIPGHRPIFASELQIIDSTLPGERPIMVSDPHLMEASLLPGGRPIASNEIDDGETLMGFLD
jgi:hypothetical protein